MRVVHPCWLVLLLIAAAGCGPQAPTPRPAAANDRPAGPREEPAPIAGTASCSGRACHAGLAPRAGKTILQDEYTKWITEDRHALAYAVLKEPRSQGIAERLGLAKPAHEATECLVCHMTPQAAKSDSRIALEERLSGVGCESCHGSASNWLALHTTEEWTTFSAEEKQRRGMRNLADVPLRAKTCAGCHIGAGPEADLPARDVNHDLIAAGHPRLAFAFAAFTLNTPPHWNAAAKPIDETTFWAIGQLACAKSALDLLAYRAEEGKNKPWPEFAEYDCYACHHDLRAASARQQHGYGKHLPGSLPWNDWYYFMPNALAELDGEKQVSADLTKLDGLLRRPYLDRKQVGKQAKQTAAGIDAWMQRWHGNPPTRAKLRPFLLKQPRIDWDDATQIYLGLSALRDPDDPAEQAALKSLYRYLEFKTEPGERFNSPRDFKVADFERLLNVLPR